jgi:hypothetical protein
MAVHAPHLLEAARKARQAASGCGRRRAGSRRVASRRSRGGEGGRGRRSAGTRRCAHQSVGTTGPSCEDCVGTCGFKRVPQAVHRRCMAPSPHPVHTHPNTTPLIEPETPHTCPPYLVPFLYSPHYLPPQPQVVGGALGGPPTHSHPNTICLNLV